MKKTNGVAPTYFVVVVEDTSRNVVVGTATLVLEQKFIRGASVAGHVEDVVTDKSVRGRGIGKVLMEALLSLSRHFHCYKTVLDCDEKNVPFYAQFGFKPKVLFVCFVLCCTLFHKLIPECRNDKWRSILSNQHRNYERNEIKSSFEKIQIVVD
jgi:hypothetical protein